jgi:Rrf2 family protein
MRVSLKSEYALQAVFDLACQETRGPVRIADIARRQKIPQKFLELILAGLKQGGIAESRRGAEGGYLLARPTGQITVGEVLRQVEGDRVPRGRGRKQHDTPFSELWARVDEAVSGVVDRTTIAELRDRWLERQAAVAPTWEI